MGFGDRDGKFTFISPHGNSVIDLFMISDDLINIFYDMKMTVHSRVESWHMPISLSITFVNDTDNVGHIYSDSCTNNIIETIVWNVEKLDYFMKEITSYDFKSKVECLMNSMPVDFNNAVNEFTSLLSNAACTMKKKVYIIPEKPTHNNSWFDVECQNLKDTLRRILHKYSNNRSQENKDQYVALRREYKQLLDSKKRIYSENKVASLCEHLNDSSMFWREIRKILCPKRNINNISIYDWFIFFQDMFRGTDHIPPICLETIHPIYVDANASETPLNSDITKYEIIEAIDNVKSRKSPGLDCIVNEMLMKAAVKKCPNRLKHTSSPIRLLKNQIVCRSLSFD